MHLELALKFHQEAVNSAARGTSVVHSNMRQIPWFGAASAAALISVECTRLGPPADSDGGALGDAVGAH